MATIAAPGFATEKAMDIYPQVSRSRRWWVVALLFLASLINYLDRATLSIALPVIGKELALGPARKGLLLSAFFWSYSLMQVPMGLGTDRLNLRWLYAAAFSLWSCAQGLVGVARQFFALVLARIVLGVGESIYLPGSTKIVSLLYPPQERGLPCGAFDFGTRLGMALGGLLVPTLLVLLGWRRSFQLIGFSALLWLIPWLAVCPRRLGGSRKHAKERPGQIADPSLVCSASTPSQPHFDRTTADTRHLRRVRPLFNRQLVGQAAGFFCFGYYWYLFVTWLPDYLVTVRHLPVVKAGAWSALPFLIFGFAEPLGGWISDRLIHRGWDATISRKGVLTAGFLTGLLLIPAVRARSATTALGLIMAASLVGLAAGNLIVILQSCAPAEDVGLWTGISNFSGNLAGLLAPLATGILISRTGSYSPGFALAAIVLVAGLAAYWLVVGRLEAFPHAVGAQGFSPDSAVRW